MVAICPKFILIEDFVPQRQGLLSRLLIQDFYCIASVNNNVFAHLSFNQRHINVSHGTGSEIHFGGVAANFNHSSRNCKTHFYSPINIEKAIHWVEQKIRLQLADEQREVIIKAVQSKVMVVTGGPGVGKTTVVNAVVKIFPELDRQLTGLYRAGSSPLWQR
jgi:ATP-dependent Lon protease